MKLKVSIKGIHLLRFKVAKEGQLNKLWLVSDIIHFFSCFFFHHLTRIVNIIPLNIVHHFVSCSPNYENSCKLYSDISKSLEIKDRQTRRYEPE